MNFELLRHLAAEGLNEAALLALDESDLKELTNPDNSPLRPLQVLALKSHLRTRHIDATPSEASVDYIAPRPRMESPKSEVEELKAQIARLENAFAAKTGEGQWQGSRMQADEVFRTKLPAERRFGEMEQQLRESAAQASQWMVERDRLMAMHLAQVEHLAAGKAEAERRAAEAEQLLRQSAAETAELKEERDQLAIHLAELKRNTEPMNLQTWPTAKTVSAEKNTTPAPAHGQSEAGQKAAERRVIAILMNGSELWRSSPGLVLTTAKWGAVLATVCGVGTVQMWTKGVVQYARMLADHTQHLAILLWHYDWDPPPGSVFAFDGYTAALPMGKCVYGLLMLIGIAIVLAFGWFEARWCQDCGDRLVDVVCPTCARGQRPPRLCRACHTDLDPADCHVDAQRVLRLGQRTVSLVLFLVGGYLLVAPTYGPTEVAALLTVVAISEFHVMSKVEHCIRLSAGQERPSRRPIPLAEYQAVTQETTRRELDKLRNTYMQRRVDCTRLSDVAQAEVHKFMFDPSYRPQARMEPPHRKQPGPGLFTVAAALAVLAVAIAYHADLKPSLI